MTVPDNVPDLARFLHDDRGRILTIARSLGLLGVEAEDGVSEAIAKALVADVGWWAEAMGEKTRRRRAHRWAVYQLLGVRKAVARRHARLDGRSDGEPTTNETAEIGPAPDRAAVGAEVMQAVCAAIDAQQDNIDREVALRLVLGWTQQEIAEELGLSAAPISRRCAKVRKSIKKSLLLRGIDQSGLAIGLGILLNDPTLAKQLSWSLLGGKAKSILVPALWLGAAIAVASYTIHQPRDPLWDALNGKTVTTVGNIAGAPVPGGTLQIGRGGTLSTSGCAGRFAGRDLVLWCERPDTHYTLIVVGFVHGSPNNPRISADAWHIEGDHLRPLVGMDVCLAERTQYPSTCNGPGWVVFDREPIESIVHRLCTPESACAALRNVPSFPVPAPLLGPTNLVTRSEREREQKN